MTPPHDTSREDNRARGGPLTHDCGHVCCPDPSDQFHAHVVEPVECPHCSALAATPDHPHWPNELLGVMHDQEPTR